MSLDKCFNYLKSLILLVLTPSAVHSSLMQGFIVLRRSDRYWSGVFFLSSK